MSAIRVHRSKQQQVVCSSPEARNRERVHFCVSCQNSTQVSVGGRRDSNQPTAVPESHQNEPVAESTCRDKLPTVSHDLEQPRLSEVSYVSEIRHTSPTEIGLMCFVPRTDAEQLVVRTRTYTYCCSIAAYDLYAR